MPDIWRLIVEEKIAAYNLPSGVLFDMHRDAAARRPGVLTKVGLDTFVDPDRQGGAMNARAAIRALREESVVRRGRMVVLSGDRAAGGYLRATTADERGNLS